MLVYGSPPRDDFANGIRRLLTFPFKWFRVLILMLFPPFGFITEHIGGLVYATG